MTKEEIFAKLQTEVTIRGLSPGTYYTYMRAIDLFLNWSDKPYEELEEIDFLNYLLWFGTLRRVPARCFPHRKCASRQGLLSWRCFYRTLQGFAAPSEQLKYSCPDQDRR